MRTKILISLAAALFWLWPAFALAAPTEAAPLAGATCGLCHFCPQPLGFCVLLWAAAILFVLIVLVSLLGRKKKCPVCKARNKLRAEYCSHCHYHFATGALPLIPDQSGFGPQPPQPVAVPLRQPASAAGDVVWQDRSAVANKPIPPKTQKTYYYEQPPAPAAPTETVRPAGHSAPPGEGIPPAVMAAAISRPAAAAVPAASDRKPCPHCGRMLPARAMFCAECGKKV